MENPITGPHVDDLKKTHQPSKAPDPAPTPTSTAPLSPAESDQDAGSGYNADHTIPQP